MPNDTPKPSAEEMAGRSALKCLAIEVPQSVHRSVCKRVEAWIEATSREAEKAAYERAAKAMCVDCKDGNAAYRHPDHSWVHDVIGNPRRALEPCAAEEIRALIQETEKPCGTCGGEGQTFHTNADGEPQQPEPCPDCAEIAALAPKEVGDE